MTIPFSMRQQQILASVEATSGTMATLVASNGGVRIVVGATPEHDWPTEPRNLARKSMTPLGHMTSTQATNINFRSEINTPDTVTATSEHATYLRGCGCTVIATSQISVGTISGGPFVRGETVTGAGGGTGRVLVAASATRIYYETIAGALQNAETLTGSTSGATCTSSSVPSAAGWTVRPRSDGQESISLELQEDGMAYSARGCMGSVVMSMENAKIGYFDFTFSGPKNDSGSKAMTTGITYDAEEPPILQGAAMLINGSTVVGRNITIDLGNTVVHRPDFNALSSGFLSDYINGREPKMTISMEMPAETTLDLYGLWEAKTKVAVSFVLGSAAGKRVYFFADLAQITNVSPGDGDGVRLADVELTFTGDANKGEDEWEMVMI